MMNSLPPTDNFPCPAIGVVVTEITQASRGRIKYAATYWPAELDASCSAIALPPNTLVLIVGRRGLVLLVRPS
jgi:membrane protein implicated in regulation of membrane protease activity